MHYVCGRVKWSKHHSISYSIAMFSKSAGYLKIQFHQLIHCFQLVIFQAPFTIILQYTYMTWRYHRQLSRVPVECCGSYTCTWPLSLPLFSTFSTLASVAFCVAVFKLNCCTICVQVMWLQCFSFQNVPSEYPAWKILDSHGQTESTQDCRQSLPHCELWAVLAVR